jgi:Putative metal-binding motif
MGATRLAVVALLGACASKPSGGARLQLEAKGSGGGSEINVVLVDPTPSAAIPQRISPTALTTGDAVYYLEAVPILDFSGPASGLDQFVLELGPQPGAGVVHYIPFVVIGPLTAPTAVGTFVGNDGNPAAIEIPAANSGMTEQFPITLEAVTAPTDQTFAPGDYEMIQCNDANSGLSGFVWQPMAGGDERRVLLEDSGDASRRPLDLDCDTDTADDPSAPDCDDTNAAFYAGAPEVCDGEDTNCDGQLLPIASSCPYVGGSCTMGVQYCPDVPNGENMEGACLPAAQCAASDAFECLVPDRSLSDAPYAPCLESVADIAIADLLCADTTCIISVSRVPAGWHVVLSTSDPAGTANTGSAVVVVTTDNVWVDFKPDSQVSDTNDSLGEVDLAVVQAGSPIANIGIDLVPTTQAACSVPPAPMNCSAATTSGP